MNEKALMIIIVSLLAIGFVAVLLVAVPWLIHHGSPNWKQLLLDDGLILVALALFVYGFYMNTKMH